MKRLSESCVMGVLLKPAVLVCRFLPAQDEGAEANGDHFELAAPEVQQEVRSRAPVLP